jgi:hypothetical protein
MISTGFSGRHWPWLQAIAEVINNASVSGILIMAVNPFSLWGQYEERVIGRGAPETGYRA